MDHRQIARRFATPHTLAVALALFLASLVTMSAMIAIVAMRKEDDWLVWVLAASFAIFYGALRWRARYPQMLLRASIIATLLFIALTLSGLLFGGRFAIEAGRGGTMPAWASACLGTAFMTSIGVIGLASAVVAAFASWIAARSR